MGELVPRGLARYADLMAHKAAKEAARAKKTKKAPRGGGVAA
jgi:hypothetical protein